MWMGSFSLLGAFSCIKCRHWTANHVQAPQHRPNGCARISAWVSVHVGQKHRKKLKQHTGWVLSFPVHPQWKDASISVLSAAPALWPDSHKTHPHLLVLGKTKWQPVSMTPGSHLYWSQRIIKVPSTQCFPVQRGKQKELVKVHIKAECVTEGCG